ncbi:MAG: hypothetical protein ACLUIO_27350, partial [Neglectibacter timonensis]
IQTGACPVNNYGCPRSFWDFSLGFGGFFYFLRKEGSVGKTQYTLFHYLEGRTPQRYCSACWKKDGQWT